MPTIKFGANIFVDTKIDYFDGDGVYVFIFDNEIYIKRLQITGTEIIVISDNSIYEKWRLDKQMMNNFHIQGKVIIGQNSNISILIKLDSHLIASAVFLCRFSFYYILYAPNYSLIAF